MAVNEYARSVGMASGPGWLKRWQQYRLRKAAAEAGFPDLDVEPLRERVDALVSSLLGERATPLGRARQLSRLCLVDLCLAEACAQGREEAWARLQSEYGGHVLRVARTFYEPFQAREVADSLWGRLFLTPKGREDTPRIATYSGRGSLRMWLRGVVANMALQRKKVGRRDVALDEAPTPESAPSSSDPPPAEALRRAFSEALRGSLEQLDSRDRLILHLHFYRGSSLAEVGRAIDRNKSNVSRRLNKLTEQLRRDVAEALEDAGTDRHLLVELAEWASRHLAAELGAALAPDPPVEGSREVSA